MLLTGCEAQRQAREVIVRQMMRKMTIIEPGDSEKFKPGMIVTLREIREENSLLKRADKGLVTFRNAAAATSHPLLLGITKASLSTRSWVSAASFPETIKVLSQAAITTK